MEYIYAAMLLHTAGQEVNEKSVKKVLKAAGEALNLAFNAEVLTSKTTDLLLAKAYSQMLAIASEAAAQDAEAVDDELRQKLNATASAEKAKPAEEEEKEEDEEEDEEEDKEEDAAAGLGALFG